jgi:hypothetical protein
MSGTKQHSQLHRRKHDKGTNTLETDDDDSDDTSEEEYARHRHHHRSPHEGGTVQYTTINMYISAYE